MGSDAVPSPRWPPGQPDEQSPAPHFAVSERELPGSLVLTLFGELDHDSAAWLGRLVERRVGSLPGRRLLLDCSRLRFCDSSGLNALLRARHAAETAGAGLALIGVGAQVARVLEVTGAAAVFRKYSSLDEAVASGDGP
jgi:anti-anti-sigma factor